MDPVTLEEAVGKIFSLLQKGGSHQILTLNPEFLFRAQKERDLLEIAWRASLVTADGVGILWAARQLGFSLPERVAGIDLMVALCRRAAAEGLRVYFLGGRPGVAEEAAQKLLQRFPSLKVAGTQHGYFTPAEEPEVLERVRRASPHFLFVGLGSPRQERWIDRHKEELGVPILMGVGGSFDVLSGRVKRAPLWWQKMGLEWLWRLINEPRRLGRMTSLPRFAWRVWRSRKGKSGGVG
ncbi:WecB/TagA/CpsF family glycosyltransferase [Ammonifex thiophilus]|uniref:WecB/TagA/CpsF family glycosyltransferase n=1 Tax=Ammonifex thiophilus TaxID=444093 RepID=UPI001F0B9A4D|nr:WecB/TagA/CpsF family glycosyltransferase [Ammonifex thiophilus]